MRRKTARRRDQAELRKSDRIGSECSGKFRSETYRLLMEGMVKARKACKLRYLTGGAVIAYGLPVASLFRAL